MFARPAYRPIHRTAVRRLLFSGTLLAFIGGGLFACSTAQPGCATCTGVPGPDAGSVFDGSAE